MNNERWQEFIERLQQMYDVYVAREDLLDEDGELSTGWLDIVTLDMPGKGRFKIVRENKPKVLEKKMHYSNRIGTTGHEEYKLSDSDFSSKIRVYSENDFGDWQEVTPASLGL